MKRESAYRFFYHEAGFSYYPKTETRHQGRARCARMLASAERRAFEENYTFEWRQDELDSSEWTDETPAWPQWVCLMRDASDAIVQAISGVDFGRDRGPWGHAYRRVVEAELAAEQFA